MKPAPFDYVRPDTIAEAHAVLAAERGDACILAGGQTLVPMLSMRFARPKVVVDIMRLAALTKVEECKGAIIVGAGVRQEQLLRWLANNPRQPLLSAALPYVGHAQTRSRGTVCGSLAHADPSAELPLILVALGGKILLSSKHRRRWIAADAFFISAMATARADDEIIEAVSIPGSRPGEGFGFREFARRHGDFALVACAARADGNSVVLAVGGVADRPIARDFAQLQGEGLDEALDAFAFELEARDDLHATAPYRRALVRQMGCSVIEEARRCRA